MIQPIIYFFVYIFEQVVAYLFFSNKYDKKLSIKLIILCYSLSGIAQLLISFIRIPNLNSLSFFLLNSLVAWICFNINYKQSIWFSLLLTVIMALSELAFFYIFTYFLKITISEITEQSNIFIFVTLGAKAIYFILATISSKISFKEKRYSKRSLLYGALFLLPITSIVTIFILTDFTIENKLSEHQITVLIITSCLLLISNAIVFIVQEQTVRIQQENLALHLEQQKEKINMEHYEQLEKQYENSAILIHDIKRCLATIAELATESNENTIIEYIHSFYETNQIKGVKKYSSNKLINVIVTRYCEMCLMKKISINVDIRNINFDFITGGDLTAILDNLLENAYEGACQSTEGCINLQIDEFNKNYIIIKVQNTCLVAPKIKNDNILTSKKDPWHGYGLKSVRRAIEHYNGDIKFSYNEDKRLFQVAIFLHRPL